MHNFTLPQKKLLLLYNPKAGVQALNPRLFDAVNAFSAAGFLVTVYPTQEAGEIKEAVAALAAQYDVLVCGGGDGTVSEAVNALLALETRPVFGFIPSGTVNDFAASLAIPADVAGAVDIILHGLPRALDIGLFQCDEAARHFIYVAAFGIFTDVSYSTSQNTKNWLGKLAYILEGAKRVGALTAYPCEFEIDGDYIAGNFIFGVVASTRSIAGIKMPKFVDAHMDDGLFEVILVQKPANLKEHGEILAAVIAREENALVTIRKAKTIDFHAFEAIPWTLDGDFGGEYYRAEITNLQQAIEIITPP